jgi:hypothetical protein
VLQVYRSSKLSYLEDAEFTSNLRENLSSYHICRDVHHNHCNLESTSVVDSPPLAADTSAATRGLWLSSVSARNQNTCRYTPLPRRSTIAVSAYFCYTRALQVVLHCTDISAVEEYHARTPSFHLMLGLVFSNVLRCMSLTLSHRNPDCYLVVLDSHHIAVHTRHHASKAEKTSHRHVVATLSRKY